MWFLKKKKIEKKAKPKYNINEDRFIIGVHKDENKYRVNVYDKWSKRFMSDSELDRGKLLCNSTVFDSDKDMWVEMKIEIVVEKAKDRLRDDFTKNWHKLENSKSKKKKSKARKVK